MRRLAFAWLLERDFQRWNEIERLGAAPDAGKDYQDWLRRFSQMKSACEAEGIVLVCVEVDPDLFIEWCRTEGKALDSVAAVSAARSEYVAILAAG
jgi:hypothetical protein